jgi:hypothetical protein
MLCVKRKKNPVRILLSVPQYILSSTQGDIVQSVLKEGILVPTSLRRKITSLFIDIFFLVVFRMWEGFMKHVYYPKGGA